MKVSLVTVTFNSDKTLRDTIQSVLNQTYSDIEYIIVDGLSQDNTVDIIRKYEPQFQGRLKWISERDNGLYDAMNKGIRMSTGGIVGIINSDDFYHRRDIISRVVEAFQNEETKAVYGDVRFVNPDIWIRLYVIIRPEFFLLVVFGMVLCLLILLSSLIGNISKNSDIIKLIII